MPLINANQAALMQRNLIRAACDVAKNDAGFQRLEQLANVYPELRGLVRQLREQRDHAAPMLFCDVVAA